MGTRIDYLSCCELRVSLSVRVLGWFFLSLFCAAFLCVCAVFWVRVLVRWSRCSVVVTLRIVSPVVVVVA